MIRSIYANGPYLSVETSSPGNAPYIDMNKPSAGMVRYNNNLLEVYDGSSWHSIGGNGTAMVSMNHNAMNVMAWAERKMAEEAKFQALAEKNPAVADAMEQVKEAVSRLKVVAALVEEHKT